MPIYEYRCEECAGRFEVLTSFAERDRGQACPACSSERTRVLVSSFAFAGQSDDGLSAADFGGGGGCACGGSCACGRSKN